MLYGWQGTIEQVSAKKFVAGLVDSITLNGFVKANMSNPQFKSFGQTQGMAAVKQLWYKKRTAEERKNIHEMSTDEAIEAVRSAIPASVLDGWFRDANSDYKPKLAESIFSNPGTMNAGLNIAYQNYLDSTPANPMSFAKWVKTPQTMYRGDYGQKQIASDIFTSFTLDKSVAQSFGDHLTTRKIKPIDTWESYQTTGEQEFLIPV